ncbi:MAG: DUF4926 domain-containing protein [Bryobacteraceae bacterium]
MTQIPLLAPVALLVDIPEEGLSRGEMGTVVEFLQDGKEEAVLVEFAGDDGQMYATAEVKPEQVIVLHKGHHAAA